MTLGVFAFAIVIGAVSSMHLDSLYAALGLKQHVTSSSSMIGEFLRTFATWVGIFGFFFLLFKVVPNTHVSAREAAIGALVASVMFHQGGRLYGYYITGFSKYASVYGALAAVPVFLMWLYLSWVILLFGSLVSWRVQQGLPRSDSQESFTAASTGVERLRNSHVQGLLPLIVLQTVYMRFRDGTGTGISKGELSKSMKLPLAWVEDALELLGERGLIVETASAASDKKSAETTFFPAFPAQKLSLEKAVGDLLQGAQEWLTVWEHDLSIDVKEMLASVAKSAGLDISKLRTSSVADLL